MKASSLFRLTPLHAAAACSLAVLSLSAFRPPFVERMELALFDLKCSLWGAGATSERIAIVEINRSSIREIGAWPWRRETIDSLVEIISTGKPSAIGLDFPLPPARAGEEETDALTHAVRRAGNIVLSYSMSVHAPGGRNARYETAARPPRPHLPWELKTAVARDGAAAMRGHLEDGALDLRPGLAAHAAAGLGYRNTHPGADGAVRGIPLAIQADGALYAPFSLEVLRVSMRANPGSIEFCGDTVASLHVGPYHIPAGDDGALLLDYHGGARHFRTYAASEILSGAVAPGVFSGKIILVGGSCPGIFGTQPTPFSLRTPAAVLHAHAIDSVLCGRTLTAPRCAPGALSLVILGLSLLPALAIARFPRVGCGAALGAAAILGLLFADVYLLHARQMVLSTACPLLGLGASCMTGLLWVTASRAHSARIAVRGLRAIGDIALATPGSPRLIPEMLAMLLALLSGKRGFILLRPIEGVRACPGRWKILAAQGISATLRRQIFSPLRERIIADAEKSGRPVLIPRRAWHSGCVPPGKEILRYRPDFMLWLPLITRGRIVGMAYADGRGCRGCLSARYLPLLASFGARMAAAIDAAVLSRGAEESPGRSEPGTARPCITDEMQFGDIIRAPGSMHALFRLIEKAAAGTSAVLIEGETGTGKELIARAIHHHGPRREHVFIAQNCAALSESLLESELFGHVRGAFTGALRTTRGLLAMADRGTVFLDEIADCSAAVQAKLLRFLQDGVVRPVGGTQELALDVRIISATNRDLEEEVAKGNFRKDLFYRLNVIPIMVPPLRERRQDIPCLASHFLAEYAGRAGKKIEGFTGEAMRLLEAYDFPGNVRELENEIARISAMHQGGSLVAVNDLSDKIRRVSGDPHTISYPPGVPLKESMKALERDIIAHALEESQGNVTRAALALGVSRYGLYKKMNGQGIAHPARG
ncbi:MAG: sigma 54-interacting transcriptional regulator [Chlamydiota bacterium]